LPVTFTEALKIAKAAPAGADAFHVKLVCGFTPLHLQTFLRAHIQQARPTRKVVVSAGLFGNVAGGLEELAAAGPQSNQPFDAVAVALEWPDLDARLDFRNSGAWGLSASADIGRTVATTLARVRRAVEALPAGIRVGVALPSLPLPPAFQGPGWQWAAAELTIEQQLIEFASVLTAHPQVWMTNRGRLSEESNPASRLDLKSYLSTGLPYTMPHADALAAQLARVIAPPPPKKGIITDLDDTLWAGLVGEIGPDAVQWDLASHNQLHGLYQKLLQSLAGQGVLIAVASKNDPELVKQAFQRPDILLAPDKVFPLEVHWNAKSSSVERVLQTWNVGAESVVFVDDSPIELAEVSTAHPAIDCIAFPKDDYGAGLAFLRRLADLCGRERVDAEDAIRLNSIRQNEAFRDGIQAKSASEGFLEQLQSEVTLDFMAARDPRALELVNKTNQFNLNGIRYTEADWQRAADAPGALTCVVSYTDKFGPLGKISVVLGRLEADILYVDCWVLSCRAFARRIEHQCIQALLEETGASTLEFRFIPTPRNGPIQDFAQGILGWKPESTFQFTPVEFAERWPPLYHRVTIKRRAEAK
jgi:FkbH-like protein